jgi:chemotaxis protein methyltransferase CheR
MQAMAARPVFRYTVFKEYTRYAALRPAPFQSITNAHIEGQRLTAMMTGIHDMDEQQFLFLQKLLTDRTGIRFRDRIHLSTKLHRRLRTLNLENYAQYIALIKKTPEEIPYAVEAITTNETFFFRDSIHLHALEKYLDRHYKPGRVLRIWSAASSSGEEVYSIAMTVHAWSEARHISPHTIRIIGSDIDRAMIRRAIEGVYHRYQVERTPRDYAAFLMRYLESTDDDYLSVRQDIKDMVCFKSFNLTQTLPFTQPLDIVFCRNVILYFNQNLRNRIFGAMHRAIKPGGLLIMGLCEPMPIELPLGFKYTGHSIYIKTEQNPEN